MASGHSFHSIYIVVSGHYHRVDWRSGQSQRKAYGHGGRHRTLSLVTDRRRCPVLPRSSAGRQEGAICGPVDQTVGEAYRTHKDGYVQKTSALHTDDAGGRGRGDCLPLGGWTKRRRRANLRDAECASRVRPAVAATIASTCKGDRTGHGRT